MRDRLWTILEGQAHLSLGQLAKVDVVAAVVREFAVDSWSLLRGR